MIILFPFGSQVYQLVNEKSDRDYLALSINEPTPTLIDTGFGTESVEIWSVSQFKELVQKHGLKALEVYFENKEMLDPILFPNDKFLLDKSLLRRSVSATVSNAHVKAKKKFIDGEIYTGLKSYWHCIRILTMFNHLVAEGDFKPSQFKEQLEPIYDSIIQRQDHDPLTLFKGLEEDFKTLLKDLKHTFKLACPLD